MDAKLVPNLGVLADGADASQKFVPVAQDQGAQHVASLSNQLFFDCFASISRNAGKPIQDAITCNQCQKGCQIRISRTEYPENWHQHRQGETNMDCVRL